MEAISKNKLIMAKTQPYDNSVVVFSRPSTNSEWEIEDEIKPPIDTSQELIFGTNLYLNDNGSVLYIEFTIDGIALTVISTRSIENSKWNRPNLELKSLKDLNIDS